MPAARAASTLTAKSSMKRHPSDRTSRPAAYGFEGTWVGLLDPDLMRVDDPVNQFVEAVQRRLAFPGTDETVAQNAQPASATERSHVRDELLVRRPQVLRPEIGHEGMDLGGIESQASGHLIVYLLFGDGPDASRLPYVAHTLVHSAWWQIQPLLPALHPSRLRGHLQHTADVENDAGLTHPDSPPRPAEPPSTDDSRMESVITVALPSWTGSSTFGSP